MSEKYAEFRSLMDNVLDEVKDKNIIIYGCNVGGYL